MTCQNLVLLRGNFTLPPANRLISRHDGKWFHRPSLQPSEARHRILVCCIACEMKAANSLHSNDSALHQNLPCPADGRGASDRNPLVSLSCPLDQIHLRSTVVAADRLCIIET